jgi:transcription termination factor NusB
MLSVIHYISALRRLTEVEKTIIMLGGKHNEKDVPYQILAQRDFIRLEKKYYEDKAMNFLFISAFVVFFVGVGSLYYYLKGMS